MRIMLLASAMTAIYPKVFANTNAASTLWIATTTVAGPPEVITPNSYSSALDLAGFTAITEWTQIKGVGSHGEVGTQENILTYDTWDTDTVQKGKGMKNAGDPDVELARIYDDPGQVALRAAALTNLNYAFKIERNDAFEAGGTPTIIYNRGLVTGPRRPMGRNEEFDLEIFTLALQQREIVVDPAAA